MTKDEEVLAAILQERGYIVSRCREPRRVGQTIMSLVTGVRDGDWLKAETENVFVVLMETDAADYDAQLPIIKRFGMRMDPSLGGDKFYRITTD
jgi:hypothetical protein